MKRRLLVVAVFLMAGAVVNVAVAWGCAVFVSTSPNARSPDARFDALLGDYGVRGHIVTRRSTGVGRDLMFGMAAVIEDSPMPRIDLTVYRAGLPFRAFTGHWVQRIVRVENTNTSRGGPLQSTGLWRLGLGAPIPVTPTWPGFAVNTIFYATFLWLLILGPFVLRRFIRVKRSLCPACGYPIGEADVCSECGKALPARARVTT